MQIPELIKILKKLHGRGSEKKLVETGELRTFFDPSSYE